jgi:hypothetical protein
MIFLIAMGFRPDADQAWVLVRNLLSEPVDEFLQRR